MRHTRTIAATRSRLRRRPFDTFGAVLAIAVLLLRLAVPLPAPAPTAAAADLIALFGEHALCIAAAAGETPAETPSSPGDQHADHHDLACCSFHAGPGGVLPPTPDFVQTAYTALILPPGRATALPPVAIDGPAQARAPPLGA
jgi:hypothetical protein